MAVKIIVSLPRNDLALAKVAFDCGADQVKVHANVEHKASGTRFGTWQEELPIIREILALGLTGLMPGSVETLSPQDMVEAEQLGIAFIDIYNTDMPAWMLDSTLPKMIAIGHGSSLEEVTQANALGANFIEASVVSYTDYGKPLTVYDLGLYRQIVQASPKPVYVPSQKRLVPDDLKRLSDIGVQGVILGTLSLGSTPDSFRTLLPLFLK